MPKKPESLFPTYLYRAPLGFTKTFNRELASEIAGLEKIDVFGRSWSRENYRLGYSSYSSVTNLHQTSPNFAQLERRLAPHVRRFVKQLNWNLLDRKVRMTTCWVNAMSEGSYHTMHCHPLSVLSGVYYVDVPKGSSPLKIEDPRLGLMMASPPRRDQTPEREKNYLLLTPKAGQFALFESWLRHEVPPHRGLSRRLSVSFNYEWI